MDEPTGSVMVPSAPAVAAGLAVPWREPSPHPLATGGQGDGIRPGSATVIEQCGGSEGIMGRCWQERG